MRAVLALVLLQPPVAAASRLVVCTVLDAGFNMNSSLPAALPAFNVRDLRQVQGFDADSRVEFFGESYFDRDYELRVYGTYAEVNVRVRARECDVGWAPFYVTATRESCRPSARCLSLNASHFDPATGRLPAYATKPYSWWEDRRCCVDFTVNQQAPVWDLSVLYRSRSTRTAETMLASFFSPSSINILCMTVLCVVAAGHAIWIAERKSNADEFPDQYIDGIDDGIWWAAVTVTTVGYGDKAPSTPFGRVIGIVWMFSGLFVCSIFMASVSAALTVRELETRHVASLRDVAGQRVCTYPVLAREMLATEPVTAVSAPGGVVECGALLERGKVDAILMDRPIVEYYCRGEAWCRKKYAISLPLSRMMVAFALPEGSEGFRAGFNDAAGTNRSRARAAAVLGDELNVEMIRMYDRGALDDYAAEWFDAGELTAAGVLTASESDDGELNWALTSLALAFSVLYVLMQVYLFLRMLHRRHSNKHPSFFTNASSSSLKDIASATAKNTKYVKDSLKYHMGLEESVAEKFDHEGMRRLSEGGERWLERNEWFAASLSEKDWGRQIFRQQANQGEHVGGKLDAIMQRLERLESTRGTTADASAAVSASTAPQADSFETRELASALPAAGASSRVHCE